MVSVFTIRMKIRMILEYRSVNVEIEPPGQIENGTSAENDRRPSATTPQSSGVIRLMVRPRPDRPSAIATSAPIAESSARCRRCSAANLILRPEEQQRGEDHQAR